MKVSLITLHRITNFGSMLQTYATQTAIEKLGHTVEVIDYVPEGMSFGRAVFPKGHQSVIKRLIKFLPLLAVNAVQFHIVNRFMKRYIHVSPRRYRCYRDLLNHVPQADAYVSGSDQVWNTQNNNPPDDLKAYYLQFAPEGKKRVAYAGSFGKTDFSEEEKAKIHTWLSTYDAISVREDTALDTLRDIGIDGGVHVVDPSLLLSADEWRAFCTKPAPKPGYVFIYNLNRNKVVEQLALEIARKNGWRVVNFADSLEFVPHAQNRFGNTAMDLLAHVANADFVVTDSFHGTAFSLNFERPFLCVPAPKYNSRLESILRQTGLIDTRLVTSVEEGLKAAETPIDYDTVRPGFAAARDAAQAFLEKALVTK